MCKSEVAHFLLNSHPALVAALVCSTAHCAWRSATSCPLDKRLPAQSPQGSVICPGSVSPTPVSS